MFPLAPDKASEIWLKGPPLTTSADGGPQVVEGDSGGIAMCAWCGPRRARGVCLRALCTASYLGRVSFHPAGAVR